MICLLINNDRCSHHEDEVILGEDPEGGGSLNARFLVIKQKVKKDGQTPMIIQSSEPLDTVSGMDDI